MLVKKHECSAPTGRGTDSSERAVCWSGSAPSKWCHVRPATSLPCAKATSSTAPTGRDPARLRHGEIVSVVADALVDRYSGPARAAREALLVLGGSVFVA